MKILGKFLYDEQLVASVVDNFDGDLFALLSFKGGASRAGEIHALKRPTNSFE